MTMRERAPARASDSVDLSDTLELLASLTQYAEAGAIQPAMLAQAAQHALEEHGNRTEILIAVGICTHLGCSPTHRPDIGPADLGTDWLGGFFCPCHGSRYDLAGRVYKSQPAPLNLPVPPHSYESADVIILGVDQEKA